MSSARAGRLAILVILPERRRWLWHDRLLRKLRRDHDVAVATSPSRAYPLLLRAWLGYSARKFIGAVKPVACEPLPRLGEGRATSTAAEADLIVDLSEGGAAPDGPRVIRPLYEGSVDSLALVARLIHHQCPYLELVDRDGAALVASFAAIEDKTVLGCGLAQAFVRIETMIVRACAGKASPLPPRPARPTPRYRSVRMLALAARLLAGELVNPLRRSSIRHRHWNVALRWDPAPPALAGFDVDAWRPLEPDSAIFYADPFVIEEAGRYWLFAEACPYATGKGVIACAEYVPGQGPAPFSTVIEQPYHLSYPFVLRSGGDIWLIPESSANGGLDFYRAAAFPSQWVLERRLFEDWRLVDATLFEHDGRLWLLAGAIGDDGGSGWDELFAWHAPGLEGPWTAHELSPIKSDCRGARPAGRVQRIGGKLMRPAQRCERAYGEALVWFEIRTLTADRFEEVEVGEWRAAGEDVSGPHAADLSTPLQAIDFRSALTI